ncbi:hypothetical protein BDB01DRAFT_903005 [Pilobolus umbonatus]|nr:hypothetical protein BDB01DRAFT_903005 [Pilobolus umbonatus]
MESTESWLKRPSSTIHVRKVDKELQHIKSLAVVSVLNKSFKESTTIPPRLTSSASSTTSSESTHRNRARSQSCCVSSRDLKDRSKKSSTSLRDDYFSFEYNDMRHVHSDHDSGTEKETVEKRLTELQELYTISAHNESVHRSTIHTQSEIIRAQDRLIEEYADNMSKLEAENRGLKMNMNMEPLTLTREDVMSTLDEVHKLQPLREYYLELIQSLQEQVALSDQRISDMDKIAHEIQKECMNQTQFIDSKLHKLSQQLVEKDKVINKMHMLHNQDSKQLLVVPSKSETRRSLFSEPTHVIWESGEEGNDFIRRSSSTSRNNSSNRSSPLTKWKSTVLPPPSPPPSQPLPPIPTDILPSKSKSSYTEQRMLHSEQRNPHSELRNSHSELSNSSNITLITHRNISTDAFGDPSPDSKSWNPLESDISMTDSEYYKEFTDQLQARLSISKEIDDLRVWEPSDYADIQKKIESNNWLEGKEQLSRKEQIAFWKGMKKKLRS